jgi:hypothetical protein
MYDQVIGNKTVKAGHGKVIDLLFTFGRYGLDLIPVYISMP